MRSEAFKTVSLPTMLQKLFPLHNIEMQCSKETISRLVKGECAFILVDTLLRDDALPRF